MIRGVHAMFYTSQADELRAFLRDKLRFPFTDVGEGWLIFDLPEGDVGCHPIDQHPGSVDVRQVGDAVIGDVGRNVARRLPLGAIPDQGLAAGRGNA